MQKIVSKDSSALALTNLPDPRPSAAEVLIDVRTCGTFHTDFDVLRANYSTSAFPVVSYRLPLDEIARIFDGNAPKDNLKILYAR